MHALIVDDSKPARDRMQRLLERTGIETASASCAADALSAAKEQLFAIAFLDIEMPETNGLKLAQALLDEQPGIVIVFVTAYSDYAFEAFEAGGVGYLLKPVDPQKLDALLTRLPKNETAKHSTKPLLLKQGRKIYLAKPEEIYYLKADLDEVIVRTKESEGYLQKRFYELESLLAPYNFFKVHRSLLVNLDFVKSLESVEQSKFQIKFRHVDDVLTSSKEGAKKLREYLEKA